MFESEGQALCLDIPLCNCSVGGWSGGVCIRLDSEALRRNEAFIRKKLEIVFRLIKSH